MREYRPLSGWRRGPKGIVSDDTQMTMWLAESILATAHKALEAGSMEARDRLLDPHDMPERVHPGAHPGESARTPAISSTYKVLGWPRYKGGFCPPFVRRVRAWVGLGGARGEADASLTAIIPPRYRVTTIVVTLRRAG